MKTRHKTTFSGRILIVVFSVVLLFILSAARFVFVQVIGHEKYAALAEKQYERKKILRAERGEIYDRNGAALVLNQYRYSFDVYKPEVEGGNYNLCNIFARATEKSPDYFQRKLKNKSQYIQFARNLPEEKAKLIFESNVKGLREYKKLARYYPLKSTASHILGFCGTERQGLEGVEKYYNSILFGQDGEQFIFSDAKNYGLIRTDYPEKPPQKGLDISLTIKLSYQIVLEEELKKAKQDHNAKAAMGVLVDIHSGDILAMASLPNYNSNDLTDISRASVRNRCISDIFDPGSIFKPITAASLLQEGKVRLGEKIFCENGQYKIYDQVIHDHEKYNILTFEQILINSSNIGIIKLAQRLPSEKVYRYLRAFGFGQSTGIELPGEIKGILKLPSDWSGLTKASLAMGHEIAVTPLQMAMAYAALANGGILYKPHIIYKVQGRKTREIEKIRKIFDSSVSTLLNPILREVVIEGTGKRAFLENTAIAGKTGTAQKIDLKTGKYSHKSFIASFAGYFPADNPRYAMVIMVDSPNRNGYYGGLVAAPAFRTIVQRIIGLPSAPVYTVRESGPATPDSLVYIPDLTGLPVESGIKILKEFGFSYEVQGKFPMIVQQYPGKGIMVRKQDAGNIILVCNEDYGRNFKMPNLHGQNVREAIYHLKLNGVQVTVRGTGKIIGQWPKAGTTIAQDQKVKITGEHI